jgi:hypothetical protein
MTLGEAIKSMPFSTYESAKNPIYMHDCESCVFVGRLYGMMADVWYCPPNHQFIVRDGNEGPEYSSSRSGFTYEGVEIPALTDYVKK